MGSICVVWGIWLPLPLPLQRGMVLSLRGQGNGVVYILLPLLPSKRVFTRRYKRGSSQTVLYTKYIYLRQDPNAVGFQSLPACGFLGRRLAPTLASSPACPQASPLAGSTKSPPRISSASLSSTYGSAALGDDARPKRARGAMLGIVAFCQLFDPPRCSNRV